MSLKLLNEKIDKAVEKYISHNTPGMALLIGEKGKVVYCKGFGMADLEIGERIKPEGAFLIASLTKQFTTTAIMIMKEKGLLDYDESIGHFFTDFPYYINKVTVRHLMTHTSGIKEYLSDEFFTETEEMKDEMTQDRLLDIIKTSTELQFEPGTSFSYSNSAYVMLGSIIEKISGISFAEYIKENIFSPLGMNNSIAAVSSNEKIDKLVSGYRMVEGGIFKKTPYNMSVIGWADGNIISTVGDLFIWQNALYTEKLISRETMEEAWTPYMLRDGTCTGYGFGWFISRRKELKEIWHTGGTLGYSSYLSHFVEKDAAIIMLSNYQGINSKEIVDEIIDLYYDPRF